MGVAPPPIRILVLVIRFLNTPIPEKTGSCSEMMLKSPWGEYSKQQGE